MDALQVAKVVKIELLHVLDLVTVETSVIVVLMTGRVT